ncbi:hypothetical protein M2345_000609 [Sphingobium sp. B8D3D]|nr:hypothetical protein [Sphingobium sp. B8D3D]MCW2416860.1 hypothetical protein [Sphingobium sp. B8D3A]
MMLVALQRTLLIVAIMIAIPFLFARGIARISGDKR